MIELLPGWLAESATHLLPRVPPLVRFKSACMYALFGDVPLALASNNSILVSSCGVNPALFLVLPLLPLAG